MNTSSAQPAVEFKQVTKRFDEVVANDRVSFTIGKHAIHGVVGENGAGKSTIMKVLYGLYQPDGGEISVHGKRVNLRSPLDAIALGIGMVHQHFMLVPTMSVWQNVVLGDERAKLVLNRTALKKQLEELQQRFGFSLPLDKPVEELSVGHRQQVEILKLLYRNAEVLILDEPTAVLTPQEVTVLFGRLQKLWESGKTIILITHKLKEILGFTHSVTIMRHGKVVETVETKTLNEASLAEKIVGRKLKSLPPRAKFENAKTVLSVQNVSTPREGRSALHELSLHVNSGEIVGIAGVEGNGQNTLIECLAGIEKKFVGEIYFEELPLHSQSAYALKQKGFGCVPSDRHHEGCVLSFPVWENFILGHHREPHFCHGKILAPSKIFPKVNDAIQKFDIRPANGSATMAGLSGGNQQKVILAREMSGQVKCLIVAHPTRGVDIGAIEFIHSQMIALRDAGAGILLISSELEEILALADRILVMFEGKIHGEVGHDRANENQIGLWMTGGRA